MVDEAASDGSGAGLLGWDAAARPGGPGASQTDWSMIFRAAAREPEAASEALDQLARRYWPAIYAFIRSSGRDVHEAADLTQGFVCDVILQRELFAVADPRRGRFRALLLRALRNYLREQHRRSQRLKRVPRGGPPLHLDEATLAIDTTATPDRAFAAQWGATLVRQVFERVRAGCVADGLDAHWTVFEERVVKPILLGETPADYDDLVGRLSLKHASQAANMVITVKRRVVRELLQEVRRTVEDRDEVTAELRDLLHDVEGPS